METYGFPTSEWQASKDEAREAMIRVAQAAATISYADLVDEIESIRFKPHDFLLFHLLGQISTAESEQGRGMPTVVVVRREDGLPGEGFFELARELGLDPSNRDEFWVSEINRVYSIWKSPSAD